MRRSPRLRRLESDWTALQQLRADSSLFDFIIPNTTFAGPPETYVVQIRGRGLWRPEGSDRVLLREGHEILVRLGAAYPRMIPELVWRTPIFHPNISAHGAVCLGGYSTHWAPSLQLDELCVMLWDIARYANYDANSPYNRAAAHWVRAQKQFSFPIDSRPLRDRMAWETGPRRPGSPASGPCAATSGPPRGSAAADPVVVDAELVFVDDQIVAAQIVTAEIAAGAAGSAETGVEGERRDNHLPVLYIS